MQLLLIFQVHQGIYLFTLINVPFIPRERDSMTPALSSLRKAFTMTDRVMPTLSATFEAISKPSVPPSSSNICSIASFLNMKVS